MKKTVNRDKLCGNCKQIPGFYGVHKQHEKDKATKRAIKKGFPKIKAKPMAGGKAWPFSMAAKKHAKAGRAMVRALSKVPPNEITALLNVTQRDINLGNYVDPEDCPIVRALKRANRKFHGLAYSDVDFGMWRYSFPKWLKITIGRFDKAISDGKRLDLKPFSRKVTFTLIKGRP